MLSALLSIIFGDRDQGKLLETHDNGIETRKAFRELFLRTLCPYVCQPIIEDRLLLTNVGFQEQDSFSS